MLITAPSSLPSAASLRIPPSFVLKITNKSKPKNEKRSFQESDVDVDNVLVV